MKRTETLEEVHPRASRGADGVRVNTVRQQLELATNNGFEVEVLALDVGQRAQPVEAPRGARRRHEASEAAFPLGVLRNVCGVQLNSKRQRLI